MVDCMFKPCLRMLRRFLQLPVAGNTQFGGQDGQSCGRVVRAGGQEGGSVRPGGMAFQQWMRQLMIPCIRIDYQVYAM